MQRNLEHHTIWRGKDPLPALFSYLLPCALALVWFLLQAALLPASASAAGDMIAPVSNLGACLSVDGALAITPAIRPLACRGASNQLWTPDANGKWTLDQDPTYCLARKTASSWDLTVFPCTDTRAISLQADAAHPGVYVVTGTTLALDNYGSVVGLYTQHNGSSQQWRWFQNDLTVVLNQGCNITYPFAYNDSATYQRELACDRVAKVQPPYTLPANAMRDPSIFPGVVPANTPTVTQSFDFNLAFKDNSYLRTAATPGNWKSTGLYAPANQIVRVTVNNATIADLQNVYVQLGVHTDVLSPTSSNVQGGTFNRYPSVVIRILLQPGENLVRSPYGGPIVLVSTSSLAKMINVTIANAVQAPYLKVGETTEAQWLARRTAPAPYAELESEIAIIHVPSSEVSNLSYADALNTANYYSQVGWLHNEFAGLSVSAALPHQPPEGQYRHTEDKQISAGWGHSGFPIMYYNDWHIGIPQESVYRSTGWGVYHELGHNYQMGAWSYVYGTEVTVNLFSLYAQEKLFGNSRLIDSNSYAAAIAILNNPAVTNKWGSGGAFEQLVFLDQIRLGLPNLNWNLWTQLMRRYREMSASDYNALNTDQAKRDKFLTLLCDLTNSNLTPHFDAWTIAISQSAKDDCATKAPLTRQIWLIDDAQPRRAGAGSGTVLREYWTGINGATLASLTSNPAYPNNPSGSNILTRTLETPSNWGDNYGERVRGYLHPPVTGAYRFWIAGDDVVRFALSTDEDPIHARAILTLTTATGNRGFDDQLAAIQRSQPINLIAGQKYYFELLHKENSGGDHAAIAWEIPATASEPFEPRKVIDARFLSRYQGDLALRKRLGSSQASNIAPGGDATFTLEVFNQGTAVAKAIQIMDHLPAGFTLSPVSANSWQTGYRYIRFQALSEAGNRGPWSSMAELNVLDPNGQPLPRTNWRIVYVDSENPDSRFTNALDGDPATIWHTMWWTSPAPPHPHEVQIDLGALYKPSGFTYLPRQSGGNGRVGDYRFYVSVDGVNWVQVAQGTFPDNSALQTVNFTLPAPRQALRVLPGPIAPGASAVINITLRSTTTITPAIYPNSAEILFGLDGTNSRIRDQDSTGDGNNSNDTLVDDEINNAGGDEDDQDVAAITVVTPNACIGNRTWNDANANGRANSGEAGFPGVTVNLWVDDNGDGVGDKQIGTRTTNSNGGYSYCKLTPGRRYLLRFIPPIGYALTLANAAGVSDAQNSDPDPMTGFTRVIVLADSEVNKNLDGGMIPAPTATGPMNTDALQATIAAQSDGGIQITWALLQSDMISGFLLYRSPLGNESLLVSLTPELLPVASTSYTDWLNGDTQGYEYWLEVVYADGHSEQLSLGTINEVDSPDEPVTDDTKDSTIFLPLMNR